MFYNSCLGGYSSPKNCKQKQSLFMLVWVPHLLYVDSKDIYRKYFKLFPSLFIVNISMYEAKNVQWFYYFLQGFYVCYAML